MSTRAIHLEKCSQAWQLAQWATWPAEELWPGRLDLYEAAAFKRVSWATVRRACQPDRNGRAALEHERIGTSYRIRKGALAKWGVVQAREAAA